MSMAAVQRHECMIYDGPPSRSLPALVARIRESLTAGSRCLYLNSPGMVAGVRSGLYAAGTDVEHEIARGALVLSSDTSHLVGGRFDTDAMIASIDDAVRAALDGGFAGLFATGDMTWEFGPENELSKLLEYEWKLEQLFHKHPQLSGICQYHRDLIPPEAVRVGVVSHARLFISDTISRLNPHFVLARTPLDRVREVRADLDHALAVLLAAEA